MHLHVGLFQGADYIGDLMRTKNTSRLENGG